MNSLPAEITGKLEVVLYKILQRQRAKTALVSNILPVYLGSA
jgi:hypothetical protein